VQLAEMVRNVVARCREAVPEAPGALYLRPILFGTTANIGAAATPRPRLRCWCSQVRFGIISPAG